MFYVPLLLPSGVGRLKIIYKYAYGTSQNPGYMKDNFVICIESLHVGDRGEQNNVSYINTTKTLALR